MNQILKWGSIAVGITLNVLGYNLQLWQTLSAEDTESMASLFFGLGSGMLLLPPIIDYREAKSSAEKNFAQLLIVLELFLVFSAFMFFWKNSALKIPVRILSSLVITSILKYNLQQLPEFQWSVFYNPLAFCRYHFDTLRGKYAPAYPLSLGIDWLGVGYAFVSSLFGKFALIIGSCYLLAAVVRGYQINQSKIAIAFVILNTVCIIYSLANILLPQMRNL